MTGALIPTRSNDEIEMSLRFHSDTVTSFARPDERTAKWLVHLRSMTKSLALSHREVEILILALREARLAEEGRRDSRLARQPDDEPMISSETRHAP
jgi:hypothetical protein